MEQIPQLGIGRGGSALPNDVQQCSVGVSFVSNQITQQF
jgi:hypothetical protein